MQLQNLCDVWLRDERSHRWTVLPEYDAIKTKQRGPGDRDRQGDEDEEQGRGSDGEGLVEPGIHVHHGLHSLHPT